MLEEFSDSLQSLNWENIYAKKIEFMPSQEVHEIIDVDEYDSDDNDEADS
jgi:hypothetical protein